MLENAIKETDPYSLAFVDVRMPPGWDGLETLEHLWRCDPDLQAVICTAYSDFSWEEITRRLKQSDNLLILKKPFDTIEVLQLAHALTRKWELGHQAKLRLEDLDRMVQEKTRALRLEMEERIRVEEALRQTEERFSKAFHASPLPMAIQTSSDGRFVDANGTFLELTGLRAGQLMGRSASELKLWREDETKIILAARIRERVRGQQFVLQRGDGKSRTALMWTEPITLGNEASLLIIIEDVSDRLKLENQVRQAQKMEAIGSLATGIAHEFNNLLTVIQGHAGLLRKCVGDSRAGADSIERITQASVQAASLTRRLLTFSRRQPLELKPLNICASIRTMEETLARLVGERYELRLNCEPNVPHIRAEERSVHQALINLVLNARDSMPAGGTICIETNLVTIDAEAAREQIDARPGRFLCLSVADKGCGMTPEVVGRIFDPFFTTKEIGKSAGLGLSAVQAMVQQHDGWIQIATHPGKGSTFKVYLPALQSQGDETRELNDLNSAPA
jgi:PAS domain S-box-containing protein